MAVASLVNKPTEEHILEATDRLIGRYGLRKMTMEDVAQEAGVSRRTVYGYFRNKGELALASIDRVVKKAQARMVEEARSNEAPAERIYRMLVARVTTRLDEVKDMRQSLDSVFAVVRQPYLERRRKYFEQEASMLADVIREGQRDGSFGPADANETARLLVHATNAFLPYSLSVEEMGHAKELRDRIEKTAAILVNGILR